ncbi:MAG: hypothetical protein Greene041619_1189 [Candidatus Peregrinibacteria bacterium Greene0416_19]|nr:MAG: hypothetical protein Greene041619_1189 [Candidatus Peregrinibacteria bacterium Greene0416_19]
MRLRTLVIVLLMPIVAVGVLQSRLDLTNLESWLHSHPMTGVLLYVGLVATSIIALPLSSLPLLPIAAGVWGVVPAALLSVAGWWLGSLAAFGIARLGRPALERVTSLDAIDRLEKRIPSDIGFAGIVVLRMILPVDITSFALGLLKRLRFSTYASATLLGVIPFAFVWSYAGGELRRGAWLSTVIILSLLAGTVLLIRRWWKK